MRSLARQLRNHMCRGDLVIILLVIGLAAASTLVFWPTASETAATPAYVLLRSLSAGGGNEIILEIALPAEETHVVQGAEATLVIEVSGSRARVFEADCPDQICVATGWLTKPGHRSVCVPNRMVLELVSAGDSDVDDLDAIIR